MVDAICKRTLMFKRRSLSQSLVAVAGDAGLWSGGNGKYQFLHCFSSNWNNSGEGRSASYLSIAASRLTFFGEHKTLGTRPSNEVAIKADDENC